MVLFGINKLNNFVAKKLLIKLVVYIALYQSPLILTALLHFDLINVAYLTACAFIRSHLNDVVNAIESTRNAIMASLSLVWRVNQLVKFTRLGFENACWIAPQASRCQQAFSKPCLVSLISYDTHLVFSIYSINHQKQNRAEQNFYLQLNSGHTQVAYEIKQYICQK